MNDDQPGPEPEGSPAAPATPVAELVQCPCCAGTGRIGNADAACRACWMRGVVASWRMAQLLQQMSYWRSRYGEPQDGSDHSGRPDQPDHANQADRGTAHPAAAADPESPAPAAESGPCLVCDPFAPCGECPHWDPFSLAA